MADATVPVPNLNFSDGDPLTSEKLSLLYQFIVDTNKKIPLTSASTDGTKPSKFAMVYGDSTQILALAPSGDTSKSVRIDYSAARFPGAPNIVVTPRYTSTKAISLFYHVDQINENNARISYYQESKSTGSVHFEWVAVYMATTA
jgi:hypothetical protein